MKKLLITTSIITGFLLPLHSAFAQGHSTDGLYVGLDGSYDQLKDNILATPENIYSADGADIGIFAGYRQSQDQFTVAAEVRYGYSFASRKTSVAPIDGFALTHEFGAAVLPGFWLHDQFLVYGRLGYTRATLVDTISGVEFTNTDGAVEYGGGVEFFPVNNVSIRFEYTRATFEGQPTITYNSILYDDWKVRRNRFRAAITTAF
ncbi:MAG: outer membrane beta-barrel protein [Kordiimonadaceae bacterium]|nr:outer membrane beta-barrel protein [Kordiimonadaceae bacterium]